MSSSLGTLAANLLTGAADAKAAIGQLVQAVGQFVASNVGGPLGGFVGSLISGLGGLFSGKKRISTDTNIENDILPVSFAQQHSIGANANPISDILKGSFLLTGAPWATVNHEIELVGEAGELFTTKAASTAFDANLNDGLAMAGGTL